MPIEQLKSLWVKPPEKMRRSIELIVPKVTFSNNQGDLNNAYWAFNVTYAFRDALDIKYLERKHKKISHMVWTQGPIINFKLGDMLTSRDGSTVLQVQAAEPMQWSTEMDAMYEGRVTYKHFNVDNSDLIACTQMQFLQLLIYGAY